MHVLLLPRTPLEAACATPGGSVCPQTKLEQEFHGQRSSGICAAIAHSSGSLFSIQHIPGVPGGVMEGCYSFVNEFSSQRTLEVRFHSRIATKNEMAKMLCF